MATTETLENAIARPAMSGLRSPAAASGRAASSIIVATNAVLLKRVEGELPRLGLD